MNSFLIVHFNILEHVVAQPKGPVTAKVFFLLFKINPSKKFGTRILPLVGILCGSRDTRGGVRLYVHPIHVCLSIFTYIFLENKDHYII